MSRLINPRVLMLVILSAFIAGCGGGGSGGSNNVTPSSSDWDSMTWDQDNWA